MKGHEGTAGFRTPDDFDNLIAPHLASRDLAPSPSSLPFILSHTLHLPLIYFILLSIFFTRSVSIGCVLHTHCLPAEWFAHLWWLYHLSIYPSPPVGCRQQRVFRPPRSECRTRRLKVGPIRFGPFQPARLRLLVWFQWE